MEIRNRFHKRELLLKLFFLLLLTMISINCSVTNQISSIFATSTPTPTITSTPTTTFTITATNTASQTPTFTNTPTISPTAFTYIYVISTESAFIRELPDRESRAMGVAFRGTGLVLIEEHTTSRGFTWFKVFGPAGVPGVDMYEFRDTQIGWIIGSEVSNIPPSNHPQATHPQFHCATPTFAQNQISTATPDYECIFNVPSTPTPSKTPALIKTLSDPIPTRTPIIDCEPSCPPSWAFYFTLGIILTVIVFGILLVATRPDTIEKIIIDAIVSIVVSILFTIVSRFLNL